MSAWKLVEPDVVTSVWTHVCERSDAATFFHTRVWADVLASTFRQWTSKPLAIEFADGNLMVLPLMQRQALLPKQRYCESMPPGVYGGPIFAEHPSQTHSHAILKALDEFSNVIVYGNPFSSHNGFPAADCRTLHTHVLDLDVGMKRIAKGFRKGHAANISAARRKGVEISVASRLEDVDAYFSVYQDTLARWGQKAGGFYPKRLFHNLFQLPQYGRTVRLWLASHRGTVIAGAWLFYHNRHAVYWHGAMLARYMHCHPVHLMLAEAIEESCSQGFRWFDFNPSGGFEGVGHFKRGFGAQRFEFPAWRRLGAMGKVFRAKRYFQETVLHTCPF